MKSMGNISAYTTYTSPVSNSTSDYQGGYGQPKVDRDIQEGDFGKAGQANAGGREMNDSESSMSGDTSSLPNVNNEAPSSGKEGANIGTDAESAKFGTDGASSATSAGQKGVGNIGSQ
ncbi:hypothetical protein RQP46_000967 [Phenoliferia psychrophenolica]